MKSGLTRGSASVIMDPGVPFIYLLSNLAHMFYQKHEDVVFLRGDSQTPVVLNKVGVFGNRSPGCANAMKSRSTGKHLT